MATAKQLAALKKARAARKKNLAKKNPVKRAVKKRVPVKRVKKSAPRKKRVTWKKGYQMIVKKGSKTIGWWNGHAWCDSSTESKFFATLDALKKDLAKARKLTPKSYSIAAEDIKKR